VASKQELRSEETKRSILAAAGNLFAVRGYDAVTMREIAKEAGCSHTTIYIYFKDKEALLHQLSMPPLLSLMERMETLLDQKALPDEQLKYTRIYYFTLHGIVATYMNSEETVEQLMGRLMPTFQLAFEVLLVGLKQKAERSAG
jgi:AcrR family transcriptional regulator